MGIELNSAYHQLVSGAAGKIAGTYGKAAADRKKTDPKETVSYGAAADATFSKEGLDALKKSGVGGSTAEINESKLSDKAKDYLNKLREKYGDYDFVVGNEEDDLDDLMSGTSKEFSVIFTNEELEKMADDEAYGERQMSRVEDAVATAKKLAEELGSGEVDENGVATGTFFNRFGITLNADGTISIFAEMENIAAKQREAAAEARELRAEDKKEAAEEEAEKAAEEAAQELREKYSIKFATVNASSGEELLEMVRGIDWSQVEES